MIQYDKQKAILKRRLTFYVSQDIVCPSCEQIMSMDSYDIHEFDVTTHFVCEHCDSKVSLENDMGARITGTVIEPFSVRVKSMSLDKPAANLNFSVICAICERLFDVPEDTPNIELWSEDDGEIFGVFSCPNCGTSITRHIGG